MEPKDETAPPHPPDLRALAILDPAAGSGAFLLGALDELVALRAAAGEPVTAALRRDVVARSLYGQCETEGFLFDLEIIIRAGKAGLRIAEFPVTWSCDPDTRLRTGRTIVRTIEELKGIKRTVR